MEHGDVPVKDVRVAFGQTLLSKTRDELLVELNESFEGHCVEGFLGYHTSCLAASMGGFG